MKREYYSRTSKTKEKEILIDHLLLTSKLAEKNGEKFNSGKVCRQLGLLHDIGKRTESFQNVLEHKATSQDHAIVAAIFYYAKRSCKSKWLGPRLASIMAGHHSSIYTGCIRGTSSCKNNIDNVFLEAQIENTHDRTTATGKELPVADMEEYEEIKKYIDENDLLFPLVKGDYLNIKAMSYNSRMMYVRMLMSALIDADYSAAASYDDPEYLDKYFYDDRFDIDEFMQKFNAYCENIQKNADDTEINRLRNQIFESCKKNGSKKSGFLTLTAPTGTGKTLALMEFALEQAKAKGLKRIIIVLPYISIVDQNGKEYQKIFGEDNVLIDTSQTEYDEDARIYAERWSSPIIVTTSVKFFTTLFASKATKLRRLHNICNSVIVYDECQTLPTNVLNTSIEVLQDLANSEMYGSTVVFSTATKLAYEYRSPQPHNAKTAWAKSSNDGSFLNIANMQWKADEIIDDVDERFATYKKIKNTEVVWKTDGDMSYSDLIEYYKNERSVLYIFNTVKHATEMYAEAIAAYGRENCFIITSQFCSVDKLRIIDEVNKRLDEINNGQSDKKIVLVATQCVEAGVDFDFECGAREFAPLDSVIQAAGRVNRNGKYNGKFLVFRHKNHSLYDHPTPRYMETSDLTYRLAKNNNGLDFYDPKVMELYSKELYTQSFHTREDSEALYDAIYRDSYDEVSEEYKIIDSENQITVLVEPQFADEKDLDTYKSCAAEIKENNYVITKGQMKMLSKFTISIYSNAKDDISKFGSQFGTQMKIKTRNGSSEIDWFFVKDNDFYYKETGFDKNAGR